MVHPSSVFIAVCFICQKNARFADRCFSPNDDFNRVVSKEAASVDTVCKAVKLRLQYAVKTASVVCTELEDVLVVVSMCL